MNEREIIESVSRLTRDEVKASAHLGDREVRYLAGGSDGGVPDAARRKGVAVMTGVMIYHGRMTNELAYQLGAERPADESEGRRTSARGGMTLIVDFDAALAGVARCTMRDNYCKRIGVAIAGARLRRAYGSKAPRPNEEWLMYFGINVLLPRVGQRYRCEFITAIEEAIRTASWQHQCHVAHEKMRGQKGEE